MPEAICILNKLLLLKYCKIISLIIILHSSFCKIDDFIDLESFSFAIKPRYDDVYFTLQRLKN